MSLKKKALCIRGKTSDYCIGKSGNAGLKSRRTAARRRRTAQKKRAAARRRRTARRIRRRRRRGRGLLTTNSQKQAVTSTTVKTTWDKVASITATTDLKEQGDKLGESTKVDAASGLWRRRRRRGARRGFFAGAKKIFARRRRSQRQRRTRQQKRAKPKKWDAKRKTNIDKWVNGHSTKVNPIPNHPRRLMWCAGGPNLACWGFNNHC